MTFHEQYFFFSFSSYSNDVWTLYMHVNQRSEEKKKENPRRFCTSINQNLFLLKNSPMFAFSGRHVLIVRLLT